jgi:ribosomal protein S18 acetylase RimI-like enzyme
MTVDYGEALKVHRFDLLTAGTWLSALIETTPQDGDLLVVNVAVRPDQQRRGHGVRLLRHAESLAVQAGLAAIRLYTNRLFAENIRLYAALGYKIEREEALNGGVAVHMRKPLA